MKQRIFLICLLGAFLCATNVTAQDAVGVTKAAEKNAAKMAEKEAKRAAKEEAKAEKELKKLEQAEAKAASKAEKRDKNQEKFDAFLQKWEPVDVSGIDANKLPNTIELFTQSNLLFGLIKDVHGYIDYIQVETLPENEEGIVEMKITNKNTGGDISKTDALETYGKAILELTTAAATAANLVLLVPAAGTEMASNPLSGIALSKKVKDTAFAVKYSADAIPLIKAKIEDNIAAVKQSKNN
jgi:alanyl-tRNA synthetase